MKVNRKVLVILCVIIFILVLFFIVDLVRVSNNSSPIFSIKTQTYRDGGSTEYVGLGYKVIKYVKLEDNSFTYKMGTWFMKFDNAFEKELNSGNTSPEDLNVEFESINIQTHLYIENLIEPQTDIIKSIDDLENYKSVFNDENLNTTLEKYTKEYFDSKVLVIITIPESSGSNTNTVTKVNRVNGANGMNIHIQREVPEIGTTDMAMWHLLVEIDKADFGNTNNISIK